MCPSSPHHPKSMSLTQIKATARASEREIEAGISGAVSWHAAFSHSAYVFVGGLGTGLTEGDVLAVFSQFGEVVDVHLCRCVDRMCVWGRCMRT